MKRSGFFLTRANETPSPRPLPSGGRIKVRGLYLLERSFHVILESFSEIRKQSGKKRECREKAEPVEKEEAGPAAGDHRRQRHRAHLVGQGVEQEPRTLRGLQQPDREGQELRAVRRGPGPPDQRRRDQGAGAWLAGEAVFHQYKNKKAEQEHLAAGHVRVRGHAGNP